MKPDESLVVSKLLKYVVKWINYVFIKMKHDLHTITVLYTFRLLMRKKYVQLINSFCQSFLLLITPIKQDFLFVIWFLQTS